MISPRDAITGVFETFPLNVRFAGRFELTAPWGFVLPTGASAVCAVVAGACRATLVDAGESFAATTGDVLVLSAASGIRLQDPTAGGCTSLDELLAAGRPARPSVVTCRGGGERTLLVGGVFQTPGAGLHPVGSTLPPIVHLPKAEVDRAALFTDLVYLIDRELRTDQMGAPSVIKRLVELLLIHAVRVRLAESPFQRSGWADGHLHPELWPAIALMHQHPERSWTVAELADQAVMSRSAFAATFAQAVGKPPAQYLREHRMELAGRLLRDTTLGLKEIAARTGYDSVTAFSSAFKRCAGASPGVYRRQGPPVSAVPL